MTGIVIDLQALITIPFQLSDNVVRNIEFVVDTGFSGFLTLPVNIVEDLKLPYIHGMQAFLADHSTVDLDVHSARILWDGSAIEVRVLAMGQRPLLGTGLLYGHELLAQFTENGLVAAEKI